MRIIFMGTPEFAVPSLEILLENGYEVVAVVTAPDKPGGRQGLQQSAVKQFAAAKGLNILQPEKLKNPAFLEDLRAFKADLQIVVAFRMLPEAVWAMPLLGTMNLHGSLLPKYRGAAPINWAIINGEKETGVTTFLLKHEIDTGDLLFQEKVPIGPDETAGELHDKMMLIGAKLILKSVQTIERGDAKPMPQADIEATHAPKIFAETCRINFDQPSIQVHNFVRGLSPYPGAWTTMEGKTLKVLRTTLDLGPWTLDVGQRTLDIGQRALDKGKDSIEKPIEVQRPMSNIQHPTSNVQHPTPGSFVSDGKNYLNISTLDGFVAVLELQMEGKRRMSVKDFLNGHKING